MIGHMMKTIILFLLMTASLCAQGAAELIQRGDGHDRRHEPEAALKFYLQAEKMRPTDAALLVKIARQYVFRMPDLKDTAAKIASAKTGLAYSEKAAALDPKSCEAQLGIAISWGRIIQLQGNREKVAASPIIKAAAEKAVKLDPKHDYAWHMLGRWHAELAGMNGLMLGLARMIYGDIPPASHETAVECFQKAIALHPERLIHHIELGRTYARMGKKEEARKFLEKGLAMTNTEKDDEETKGRGRLALEGL